MATFSSDLTEGDPQTSASHSAHLGVSDVVLESFHHFATSFDWAFYGVWTLTLVLMVAGVVGAVVPLVPGPLLILVAAVAHVLLRPQSGVSWWCVAWMALLTVAAYMLDFGSAAMGTRLFGGSGWGVMGVVLGGMVGLFFPFPGLLVGPLVGGFTFELLFANKTIGPAAKSTWGAVLGTGLGLFLRLMVSLLMVASFLLNAWWR